MTNGLEDFNFGEDVPAMAELSEAQAEEVRVVLHKYDGDFTPEEIDAGTAGEPIETLVLENGEIVEHIINGAEGGS